MVISEEPYVARTPIFRADAGQPVGALLPNGLTVDDFSDAVHDEPRAVRFENRTTLHALSLTWSPKPTPARRFLFHYRRTRGIIFSLASDGTPRQSSVSARFPKQRRLPSRRFTAEAPDPIPGRAGRLPPHPIIFSRSKSGGSRRVRNRSHARNSHTRRSRRTPPRKTEFRRRALSASFENSSPRSSRREIRAFLSARGSRMVRQPS